MPLLEYRCKRCSADFDWLTGVTYDDTDPVCPSCGGTDHARKVSVIAVLSAEGSAAAACGGGPCASESAGTGECGGGSCAMPGGGCLN